ncbi:SAP30-binding protein [Nilaparvata lugens]|uniref:SAP30-binding protein n=1 Tax=Nilaparvata lugens TaxID=108931 RepID=UPI00193E8285|nr:SAP30-binding protein [Nilaparvata lugens]
MSYQKSVALASLTATYTDSEAEEEPNDHELEFETTISSDDEKENSRHTPPSVYPTTTSANHKMARLVSYGNDDLVVSEEETGQDGDTSKPEEEEEPIPIDEHDVQLPPEPTGRCSNELQDKIARLHEKMQNNGLDMNTIIQQRKDFRNPSIYEKLIQFCSINEFGTNYPLEVYDPFSWSKVSYYEELEKVQRAEMTRREKERKEKTKVEFVSGTAKRGGSSAGSGAEDDLKKRKSKWDQVGSGQMGSVPRVQSASLVQPASLTTSATGTKSTVISAFGSLPKKPRA